jgi:hypothetical protein
MKSIIHINQHRIKSNRKGQTNLPVITVKDYKSNRYGSNIKILDKDGNVVAKVIYSPDKPLKCGAHVWLESKNKVIVE